MVYAEQDAYVLPSCFSGLDQYMPNLTMHEVSGASHWLLNEHPDLINRYIRELLAATAEYQPDTSRRKTG